jgi:hypothetical protein
MALLSLDLRDRLAASSQASRWTGSPLRLSFPNMNRALFPRRGLIFSVLTHVAVVCAVLLVPIYFGASAAARKMNDLEAEDYNAFDHAIYLPRLGGGSEGGSHPGGGPVIPHKGLTGASAPSTRGLSDPGTQAILSDPPRPTNTFQTIMQPALKDPPILKTLVRVPNVVKTTDAGPVAEPEKEAPRPKAAPTDLKLQAPVSRVAKLSQPAPAIPAERATTADMPKLPVPADAPQRPSLPDMQAPKPQAAKADASAAPQFSNVPTTGSDDQNLLAISLVPAPPGSPTNVPDGEARGRFAISPDANPESPDSDPGSKLQSSASSTAAIGRSPEAPSGNAVGEGHVGTTEGSAQFSAGGTGGQGTRGGNGVGDGNGGNGAGNGRGSETGEGIGSGPGGNPGSGSGGGAGPGNGNFRGMSIASGSGALDPAMVRSMVYPLPVAVVSKLRRNTVIVSAGPVGGGGLEVYGALECGKVYTIFLPMPGANWTMQYCRKTSGAQQAQQATETTVIHLESPLAPPDPDSDSMYDFKRVDVPSDKAHKMILLKGTLREDGTVDNLHVYQGVVAEMDEAAALAFGRWKFKPAMQQNKAVSVEILVGIPVESTGAPTAH